MRSRARLAVGAGLLALATAGCGHRPAPAAEQPYAGSLYETRDRATYPRAGAAGDVVQCRHFGAGGFEAAAVYAEGATADSPDYDAHAVLPDDAAATGFSRGGQRLWLAADHQTAYVGAHPSDVEAWPVEARPLGCA